MTELLTAPSAQDLLVGRDAERDALAAALADDEVRLVTVVGPGGVGKTTLSRAVAGDVPFASLEGAASEKGVCLALLDAFDASGLPPSPDSVASVLAGSDEPTVIIDNAERVSDVLADLVGAWMGEAHTLVVTSRHRLSVPGEVVLKLKPLDIDDAVELFERRATERDPTFDLERHRDDVESLVESLDGLPLAVELAARRAELMSPATMLERLGKRGVLTDRTRTERHQSLEACLEWSWDLLSDNEEAVLRQLGIWTGWFDFDSVEQIVEVERGWVGDILQGLIDKSWVHVESTDRGQRFVILESVRRFVRRRSEPDVALLHRVADFLEHRKSAVSQVELGNAVTVVRALTERDPSRAADFLFVMSPELRQRGFADRLAELGEACVQACTERVDRARAQVASSTGRYLAGRPEDAVAMLDEAIGSVDADDHPDVVARGLYLRGVIRYQSGDVEASADDFEAAYELVDRIPSWIATSVIGAYGELALARGDLEGAREYFDLGIELARDSDDPRLEPYALMWSVEACLASGDLDEALRRLARVREIAPPGSASRANAGIAIAVALARTDPDAALAVIEETLVDARACRVKETILSAEAAHARLSGREDPDQLRSQIERCDFLSRNEALALRMQVVIALWDADRTGEAVATLREMMEATESEQVGGWLSQYLVALRLALGEEVEDRDDFASAALEIRDADPERRAELLEEFADPVRAFRLNFLPEPLELLVPRPVDPRTLRVADDVSRFLLPDGTEHDISNRHTLRRFFSYMLDMHDERPDDVLSLEQLMEGGWPDETMTFDSGSQRVYAAIKALRKLGLGPFIETGEEGGYRIAPDVAVRSP